MRRKKVGVLFVAIAGMVMVVLFQNCGGGAVPSSLDDSGADHADAVVDDAFVDVSMLRVAPGQPSQVCQISIQTGPSMNITGVDQSTCSQMCFTNDELYPDLVTTCSFGSRLLAVPSTGQAPVCVVDSDGNHVEIPNLSEEQCQLQCSADVGSTCVYGATVLQSLDDQGVAAGIAPCKAALGGGLTGDIALGRVANDECSKFCKQLDISALHPYIASCH